MSSGYYTRETVAFKFKWELLKKWDGPTLTQDMKEKMWEGFKLILKGDSKISPHQAETWKYPSDLIKNA